jgi:hypothetical protein
MQKYYKLLSKEMTSYNNTKWEIGVPISIIKEGNTMCSGEVLHCYNHPLLAVFLNPIHANIKEPKLFEIEVDKIVNSDGLKFASKSQTLLKEIPLPEISLQKKIEIGIKIVKTVNKNKKWNLWADKWLSGKDRSNAAAYAAYSADAAAYADAAAAAYTDAAAAAAADAAAAAAAYAAAYAAKAAAYAAKAADRNEFNAQLINIIEEILGKTYSKE